jgi:hypothetical protein
LQWVKEFCHGDLNESSFWGGVLKKEIRNHYFGKAKNQIQTAYGSDLLKLRCAG